MRAIRPFLRLLPLLGAALLLAGGALAEERLPLPRFAALQAGKVNLRAGPGESYPIQWVYQRPGLPVEIVEEFDVWRKVRDHEGTLGWVRVTLLTGKRGALVAGERRPLRRAPDDGAAAAALLDPGVIGRLLECDGAWCRIEVKGYDGWLRKDEFFGAYPSETIEP